MRIAIIGDFHGRSKLAAFRHFLREAQPDVVLQVGDCQYYEDMEVPFYFIHGNHEHWPTITALREGKYERRNLHYLVDAEAVTIGDLKIVGLGGIPRGDSRKDSPKFFDPEAYERLSKMGGVDVVLSHDTPIHFSNGERSRTSEELRTLCEVMSPRFWFSGHHHYWDTEKLGETTIISLDKWPHGWAVLDTDQDRRIDWQRWSPIDRQMYDAKLPTWRAGEQALKKSINREG